MNDELLTHLTPVVAAFAVEIDDLTLSKAGKRRVLEVVLDSDNGVDLDTVAQVSRAISEYLDEHDVLDDMPYLLEVGSRGVGRPLTKPAHWRRNAGRLVKFTQGGHEVTGRILRADDDSVEIDVAGQSRSVALADITHAHIQVEFNRSAQQSAAGTHVDDAHDASDQEDIDDDFQDVDSADELNADDEGRE